MTCAPLSSVTSDPVIGSNAEVLRRMRELERAVEAVVVGEGERLVPELGRLRRELLGLGRPVEERVRRMTVQLGVARPS